MTGLRPTGAERAPLRLTLPEPPTLNVMLDIAKERDRRGLPTVYASRKRDYALRCTKAAREQGVRPPAAPWRRWRLTRVEFRLFNLRDPIELLGGLKWPVDWLVEAGYVADDSDRELVEVPRPEQRVARADRGITIELSPVED